MSTTPGVDTDAKQRILDAAAEAFQHQGFGGTTLDEVADEVGATKGLIYYHFRSKFDLYLAVYEEGMRRVREKVEPHARSAGTGRERLERMSVAHALNLMTDLAYHHAVHEGVRARSSASLKVRQRDALQKLNALRHEYESMFREVLTEGVADGSLREVDATLAARTLLSSLNAIDMWFRKIDGQPVEEIDALARRIVNLLVFGLAS